MEKQGLRGPRVASLEKRSLVVTCVFSSVTSQLVGNVFVVITRGEFILIASAVVEILAEYNKVHQKSNDGAYQPTHVHQYVFSVNATCLPRLTVVVPALRLVSKDGQNVRYVTETSKDEEEHAKAFGRLATVVENELGHSRGDVEDGAKVAEELSPDTEREGILSTWR